MAIAASARETHISTLFFTPDRVFKLLKPVDLGFVDHSTSEARIAAADREVELNRRLAPDVYLGTADVVEQGVTVDRMIVMRRMPADRTLSKLILTSEGPDCVRAVAKKVASFHASLAPLLDVDGPGSLGVQRRNWEESFDEMARFVGPVLDEVPDQRIRKLVRTYLDGHEELFASRVAGGFIRDGHGDLLADDIFCLDDGPRILDCLAFRDDFRVGDMLADVAFLAMDLHRLSGPAMARAFMHWYGEFSNEHHPGSLIHHYVAYRALVRSKVACLRWEQGAPEFAAVARMFHTFAMDQLERGHARIVLVGGGPGTGKTTVAGRLAQHFGWTVLDTDSLRKDVAKVDRQSHSFAEPDEGIYDPEITTRTYTELVREAEVLLRSGESVVLDASWTSDAHRSLVRDLAATRGVELIQFECHLDQAIAKERVVRRMADGWNPSDATPQIIDHLGSKRDAWPEAMPLDASKPIDEVMDSAIEAVSPRLVDDGSAAPETTLTRHTRFWQGWMATSKADTFGSK